MSPAQMKGDRRRSLTGEHIQFSSRPRLTRFIKIDTVPSNKRRPSSLVERCEELTPRGIDLFGLGGKEAAHHSVVSAEHTKQVDTDSPPDVTHIKSIRRSEESLSDKEKGSLL